LASEVHRFHVNVVERLEQQELEFHLKDVAHVSLQQLDNHSWFNPNNGGLVQCSAHSTGCMSMK